MKKCSEHRRAEEGLRDTEARYRGLFENAIEGIYQSTPDGRYLAVNAALARIYGYERPEDLTDGVSDIQTQIYADPAIRERFKREIASAGVVRGLEYQVRRRDGSTLWISESARAVCGADGAVRHYEGFVEDIDRRKRGEEALRENHEKFRQVVENITDVFWMTSPDLSKIHYVSPAYERVWNRSVESVYANPYQWAEAILPEERAGVLAAFSSLGPARPTVSVEFRISRPDGTVRWISSRGFQVLDAAGKVIRLTGIASDITERKRAEESLRLLNSAVEQCKESIVITDAELDLPGPRILFVNPAFTKMTGYAAEEALGQTPRILQGPRTDKAVLSRLRKVLEKGEAFEGETINYRKDGTEFNLEWQIAPICGAGGKPTHFVAIQRDVTARKQTENALRESDEKFHQLADNVTDAFWIRSPDMQELHYVSPAFERIWGASAASLRANPRQWIDFIVTEDRARVTAAFAALTTYAPSLDLEYRIVRADGELRRVRVRGFQVRDAAGKLIRLSGIVTDITERKRLEAMALQSQKMETVGKLAGGVAHEFNSILTAIIGQSELMLAELPPGSALAQSATEISKAAGRAATLTRQLLAYGRKQILQPERLDLNQILAGMDGVFRHVMGGAVDTQIVPAPGLRAVRADAGQIEQVILNMAMNAREAMPNGGKLTLETANVSFDLESVARYPELKSGDYVMLAITDTGAGMSEEVKARVFEPFFTTKAVGEGSGLGLSTCYGIIKQSGGHISVYSEPGRGAHFKIYLPQAGPGTGAAPPRLNAPDLPRGTETILLVEDDPALREMAATLLRRLGYTVLAAANGIAALSLKQQRDVGHIDLLFTDVVMPHMSGKELADRVQALYPHTRILFTSAYTENAIVHQGVLNKGVALLQKPFTPSALARKVREILDQPEVPKLEPGQKTFGFSEPPVNTP